MAIQQFSPPYTPFVNPATGSLTQEATIFLRELWMRVGGSSAPNNNELSATEYADAGIEEMKVTLGDHGERISKVEGQLSK